MAQANSKKELAAEKALAARDALVSILRRKVKALIRESNTKEAVVKAVRETVTAMAPVDYPIAPVSKKAASSETFVIALSDWHYAEVVEKAEMGGLNEYNSDIAASRLEFYSDKIRDFKANKLGGIRFHKCVIIGLGDLVSGIIHDELERSNDQDIVEQSIHMGYLVAQFIREIAAEFQAVECVFVWGNHGRTKQKKEFKNRSANWDYVCAQVVSALLASQKNVTVEIAAAWWLLKEIEGWVFFIQHGDNGVGQGFAGIPFYALQRTDSRVSALMGSIGKIVHYFILGHFHVSGSLDRNGGGEIILCGTAKGGDEYASGKFGSSGPPRQTIFGVAPKIGKTWEWKINLKSAPAHPSRYQLYAGKTLGEAIQDS